MGKKRLSENKALPSNKEIMVDRLPQWGMRVGDFLWHKKHPSQLSLKKFKTAFKLAPFGPQEAEPEWGMLVPGVNGLTHIGKPYPTPLDDVESDPTISSTSTGTQSPASASDHLNQGDINTAIYEEFNLESIQGIHELTQSHQHVLAEEPFYVHANNFQGSIPSSDPQEGSLTPIWDGSEYSYPSSIEGQDSERALSLDVDYSTYSHFPLSPEMNERTSTVPLSNVGDFLAPFQPAGYGTFATNIPPSNYSSFTMDDISFSTTEPWGTNVNTARYESPVHSAEESRQRRILPMGSSSSSPHGSCFPDLRASHAIRSSSHPYTRPHTMLRTFSTPHDGSYSEDFNYAPYDLRNSNGRSQVPPSSGEDAHLYQHFPQEYGGYQSGPPK